jgi:hypothetical protein
LPQRTSTSRVAASNAMIAPDKIRFIAPPYAVSGRWAVGPSPGSAVVFLLV